MRVSCQEYSTSHASPLKLDHSDHSSASSTRSDFSLGHELPSSCIFSFAVQKFRQRPPYCLDPDHNLSNQFGPILLVVGHKGEMLIFWHFGPMVEESLIRVIVDDMVESNGFQGGCRAVSVLMVKCCMFGFSSSLSSSSSISYFLP